MTKCNTVYRIKTLDTLKWGKPLVKIDITMLLYQISLKQRHIVLFNHAIQSISGTTALCNYKALYHYASARPCKRRALDRQPAKWQTVLKKEGKKPCPDDSVILISQHSCAQPLNNLHYAFTAHICPHAHGILVYLTHVTIFTVNVYYKH